MTQPSGNSGWFSSALRLRLRSWPAHEPTSIQQWTYDEDEEDPAKAATRAIDGEPPIIQLRGKRVILDATLAAVYGVTTRRLNEQVRRNRQRFPDDFLLEVTASEAENLKSHFATSSWGGRRKLPLAFTEHGAIMVATILSTPRAVEMSVYVVRAFVKFRDFLASHQDLSRKLAALERSVVVLDIRTQQQFREVYDAIRALAVPPVARRRGIGFTADLEQKD